MLTDDGDAYDLKGVKLDCVRVVTPVCVHLVDLKSSSLFIDVVDVTDNGRLTNCHLTLTDIQ